MQSSKAVQLPATSGCVHAVLWELATEALKKKKKSRHFFKAQTETTALFLLCAALCLCGCRELAAPGLPTPQTARARALPKHPLLGYVSLCWVAWWWLDSVQALWVIRGPELRMLLGLLKHQRPGCSMDRFISVSWSGCLFILILDDFSPSFLAFSFIVP